jgi:hypothetical protein
LLWLFLLLLDIIPSFLWRHCCFLMVLLLLLFIDIVLPLAPPWCYSCFSLTPFLLLLLLNNVLPLAISWHYFCSFSTLLLFLLDATPTPPWHHSCSSYCKYLSTPPQCCFFFQHCYCSFCFRSVFPPFMFLRCGMSNLSKFNLPSSS